MSNESILLVDDDREMVDAFSKWFQRAGYQTTPTYHAMQCLMAAAVYQYDVAVIDVEMPDMNGLELLQELVQLGQFPVIVLSGNNEPSTKSKAMRLGAAEYLVKPTTLEQIEAAIKRVLLDRRKPVSLMRAV